MTSGNNILSLVYTIERLIAIFAISDYAGVISMQSLTKSKSKNIFTAYIY